MPHTYINKCICSQNIWRVQKLADLPENSWSCPFSLLFQALHEKCLVALAGPFLVTYYTIFDWGYSHVYKLVIFMWDTYSITE